MDQSSDEVVLSPVDFKANQWQDEKPTPAFGLPTVTIPKQDFSQALKHEYYHILEDPKRLPFFFHPFIAKTREVDVTGRRTYFTPEFYLHDGQNVPRKFFFNFDVENAAIGAAGGLLIGLGTQHYFQTYGRFARITTQQWMKNAQSANASGIERFAAGTVISWRIAKRAAVGALLYDGLKRGAETKRDKNDWKNSAFAGAFCGAAFGLRGGFQTGAFSSAAFSILAALYHLYPGVDSVT